MLVSQVCNRVSCAEENGGAAEENGSAAEENGSAADKNLGHS